MAPQTLLRHLSTLGLTLAGFSGLVVVLGKRVTTGWSPQELRSLHELLAHSLGAAMFGMLPVLLATTGADNAWTWRSASLTAAGFMLFATVNSVLVASAIATKDATLRNETLSTRPQCRSARWP